MGKLPLFLQSAQERLPLLAEEKTILPGPTGMQLNLTDFFDNAEHVLGFNP
jgi:hypothetical protein